MASNSEWSKAYAVQAETDWNCWQLLSRHPEVPACQRLHFLQMACEKLVKAHLFDSVGHNPHSLRSTHAVIRKHLGMIVAYTLNRLEPNGRNARHRELTSLTNRLASEIEWLSPACDDNGNRPSNTEYPWEENGSVRVPATYQFAVLEQLMAASNRDILKLWSEAIRNLTQ